MEVNYGYHSGCRVIDNDYTLLSSIKDIFNTLFDFYSDMYLEVSPRGQLAVYQNKNIHDAKLSSTTIPVTSGTFRNRVGNTSSLPSQTECTVYYYYNLRFCRLSERVTIATVIRDIDHGLLRIQKLSRSSIVVFVLFSIVLRYIILYDSRLLRFLGPNVPDRRIITVRDDRTLWVIIIKCL